jgi:hypothetical protein
MESTVKKEMAERALKMLGALGYKYAAVSPFGQKFENGLQVSETAEKKKKSPYLPKGTYTNALRNLGFGVLDIGQEIYLSKEWFEDHGLVLSTLQSSAASLGAMLWGKGSVVTRSGTGMRSGGLEILRTAGDLVLPLE